VQSLPPVVGRAPRVLILGSMPGTESLRRQQYYAHPRNLLWDILGELVGAGRELDYVQRLRALVRARIALWDVAKSCRREASSDATITNVEPNDLPALLARHRTIARVCCNGSTAASMFSRLVLPGLGRRADRLDIVALPSTSPANASIPWPRKLAAWRAAVLGAFAAARARARRERSPASR
jgi:hypoxanthine-DNA glycosylase